MTWIFSLTVGRLFMLWVIGAVIAYLSTAWKDGAEGCLGIVFYIIATVLLAIAVLGIKIFTELWVVLG